MTEEIKSKRAIVRNREDLPGVSAVRTILATAGWVNLFHVKCMGLEFVALSLLTFSLSFASFCGLKFTSTLTMVAKKAQEFCGVLKGVMSQWGQGLEGGATRRLQ